MTASDAVGRARDERSGAARDTVTGAARDVEADRPVVMTPSGAVRGVRENGIAVFRGVPYAEAPVGELRFAAPVPRAPWRGVLEASRFGPTPQRGDAGITRIPEHSVPGDDTLSANIWTPEPETGRGLPVVVWIHGGGFISGSPASPWYDGTAFARDGIVLVTVSYRLGFTGFGWIEGAVPNRGVLDWVRALEWVREHIAAFGGDPDRVTVAGQSAGGGAVLTLLGVPAASGLFRAGWAMSAAVADPSVEGARRRSRHLAEVAGVSADAEGFSELSEQRILKLQPVVTKPAAPHLLHDLHGLLRDGLMIGPVADGEILPTPPLASASRGPGSRIPLVLGSTADELSGALGSRSRIERFATRSVFHVWPPRVSEARARAGAGPTWTYRFDWRPATGPGAVHCIDVPFVFDRLGAPGVERVAGGAPPQSIADAMHGSLVALARDLDPGWTPDADGGGPSRVFDLPTTERRGVFPHRREA